MIGVAGVVEKFNPLKSSTLSRKRDEQRSGRRGKAVAIREITLDEVRADAISMGLATDVLSQIKAGKEASIFLASWKGHPIILKAYRFWNSSHARKKRGFFALEQMEALAAKEFDLLYACFKAGMKVPTPIGRVGNYLTMRFIGDDTEPALQLRDATLEEPEAVLDEILDSYLIMYRDVNYVHGDLSGYNILWWNGCPWIIDLPQAYKVGPWSNMKEVIRLLRRDLWNLLSHFKSYGINRDLEHILQVFLSEYVPFNLRHYSEECHPDEGGVVHE